MKSENEQLNKAMAWANNIIARLEKYPEISRNATDQMIHVPQIVGEIERLTAILSETREALVEAEKGLAFAEWFIKSPAVGVPDHPAKDIELKRVQRYRADVLAALSRAIPEKPRKPGSFAEFMALSDAEKVRLVGHPGLGSKGRNP